MNPTTQPVAFVLFAVLCPAIVCGVLLLSTLKWPNARAWIAALAVGVGYLVGHCANLGFVPPFPPSESKHALFYVTLAAMVAGVLRGSNSLHKALGWLAVIAVAIGGPWLLLRFKFQQWQPVSVAIFLLIGAPLITASTFVLDGWAERRRGAHLPFVLWLTTTMAAVALAMSGSLIYAQFGASLAGVLGACIVFSWIARDVSFARGATVIFVMVFCCFCLAGVLLSSLPRWSGLLLFYAPLAAVAVDRGPIEKLPPRAAFVVRVLAVAAVAGVAVLLAQLNRPEPSGY
jgi:hypothetical protein